MPSYVHERSKYQSPPARWVAVLRLPCSMAAARLAPPVRKLTMKANTTASTCTHSSGRILHQKTRFQELLHKKIGQLGPVMPGAPMAKLATELAIPTPHATMQGMRSLLATARNKSTRERRLRKIGPLQRMPKQHIMQCFDTSLMRVRCHRQQW